MKVGDLVKINVDDPDIDYLRIMYNIIFDDVGVVVEHSQGDKTDRYLVHWPHTLPDFAGFQFPVERGMLWMRDDHIVSVPR